jgi:hypothetical protein
MAYQYIDPTECIGDSLYKINNNSFDFDTRLINLSSSLVNSNLNLISTINSTANSTIATLSTVPYARLNQGNQTGAPPIYGCRAWVTFHGKRNSLGGSDVNNTDREILGAGNVTNVLKVDTGCYRIFFTIPMPTTGYCVNITGSNTGSGEGAWIVVDRYTAGTIGAQLNAVQIRGWSNDGSAAIDQHIMHVAVIC